MQQLNRCAAGGSCRYQIDYKTMSLEECEAIREEALNAAAAATVVSHDRDMLLFDDDDDAMSITYEGGEDTNLSEFLSPHQPLLIDTRPTSLQKEVERSMCATIEEDESIRDMDIPDETDTDGAEPVRPSPKKRSRLEGSGAIRASTTQLVMHQDVTPKAKSGPGSRVVTRSMSHNMKVIGGRSRSLNPAPTRRGAAPTRRLTGTRSVADLQSDRAAAEVEAIVKSATAGIVQSVRTKAIEMIEQELLPTIETMAEAGIREALANSYADGRRTRSSSLDMVVESPISERKD
ncbi:hypothetical protein FOL47_002348 [Perkinsus chesapeaki]|uniref:Uncharacterized protein n=1 Tax=Perkinsus chesapeaki TaxID=330153 RepID=A0A7J6KRT1_PERCH|nr:hypothetical protein FOL47_002348 [Perkinsus chesapeaki]